MEPVRQFKQHHRELLETFRACRDRALDNPDDLSDLVDFLEHTLQPHARAEEEVLYARLDELAGTPLASAGLRADHDKLRDHVEELRAASDTEPSEFMHTLIADQLQILSALLSHHVDKEETILLPYLEAELSRSAMQELFEAVHHLESSFPEDEARGG